MHTAFGFHPRARLEWKDVDHIGLEVKVFLTGIFTVGKEGIQKEDGHYSTGDYT